MVSYLPSARKKLNMALENIPHDGILLRGAPDNYIGTAEAKTRAVQVMQLDMSQEVVDELLKCTRDGRPPQILFGRNPTLRYNSKSQMLETASSKFRHELYQSDASGFDNGWSFAGLINHTLAFRKVEEVTAGTDAALEALKNNLATFTQERESRGTIISAELAPATVKRSSAKSQKHSQFLKKPSLLGSVARSSPSSSPSLSALASPSLHPAPTSVPPISNPDMAAQQALRKPLIHLLAIKPAVREDLMHKTRSNKTQCSLVLEKVARQVAGGKEWQLTDKAYKDLDVWAFKYTSQEDRQAAIDNAVRAYDRMRLSKEDKLWQMLLPKEERGKGRVLSRLNIQDGSKGALTPNPTAKVDRKTGLPKKTTVKKPVKDGEAKAQEKKAAKQEGVDADSKKAVKESKSDAGDKKPAKERAANGQTSRAQSSGETKPSSSSKPSKDHPEANAAKRANGSTKPSLTTKPKNPSPLSASPPVNASDFENDHPVHKALSASASASASPAKSNGNGGGNSDGSLKRKASDLDHDIHKHDVPSKQAKLDSSEPLKAGKPAVGTPSNSNGTAATKRKAQDMDSDRNDTPSKHRKLDPATTSKGEPAPRRAAAASAPRRPDESPKSDASTTPPVPLSYRQTVRLAQGFRSYYERYAKLWTELSTAPEPPSEARREELMRMHRKLEEMKRDIQRGALRQ